MGKMGKKKSWASKDGQTRGEAGRELEAVGAQKGCEPG